MVRSARIILIVCATSTAALAQPSSNWVHCTSSFAQAAVSACTRLINSDGLDPTQLASALTHRGAAYYRMGDYDRAIGDYTRVMALDSRNASTYSARGAAFHRKQAFHQALADFNRAIELDAGAASAYTGRGSVYLRTGVLDRAIADHTRAIEISPGYALAYDNRGAAYAAKGDYDRAIADHTRAVDLEPGNARYIEFLGYAKYLNGEYNKAASDLSRALEKEADLYAMIFRYLARARMGHAGVEAELEAAVKRVKHGAWPFSVVLLLTGKGSPETTLQAATSPEQRCEARFYIGSWLLLRGDKAAAGRELRTAESSCPKSFVEYAAAVSELKRLTP